VDIGGTNVRAGIIELNLKKAKDLAAARVRAFDLWRHADDQPSRDKAIAKLAEMLRELIERAEKENLALAPLSASAAPALSATTAQSTGAAKICQETGRRRRSTCRTAFASLFPRLEGTRPQRWCTTTPSFRDKCGSLHEKDLQLRDTHHWHQPGQRTFLSTGDLLEAPVMNTQSSDVPRFRSVR
jgi:hypothetical protein